MSVEYHRVADSVGTKLFHRCCFGPLVSQSCHARNANHQGKQPQQYRRYGKSKKNKLRSQFWGVWTEPKNWQTLYLFYGLSSSGIRRFLSHNFSMRWVTWPRVAKPLLRQSEHWDDLCFVPFQMVWEQEASLIIMLTTTVERGRVNIYNCLLCFARSHVRIFFAA